MAKGFDGAYVGEYNEGSAPYLSVGEYWDADRQNVMNWIDATGGRSMAFDFPTRTLLKAALETERYDLLKTIDGRPTGAIGWWPAMSVTFLDNHDTEAATGYAGDPFGDLERTLQGYAYLLTHPGIPCVSWRHFFDDAAQGAISDLIAVRKEAGIGRDSVVNILAADSAKYVAIIDGKVAVKLGRELWEPDGGWSLVAWGADYAVWTK